MEKRDNYFPDEKTKKTLLDALLKASERSGYGIKKISFKPARKETPEEHKPYNELLLLSGLEHLLVDGLQLSSQPEQGSHYEEIKDAQGNVIGFRCVS